LNSSPGVVEVSRRSFAAVGELSRNLNRDDVQIVCLWNPDVPLRHAGVGLARKRAMDQAVSRFNSIGRSDGIIVSFDADSFCAKDYLKKIADFYRRNTSARTANIYFEHPLQGDFDARIYHSIAQYELYLRYMRLSIEMTGHPHAIHTVGSSFTVRARTYIRVNGMGRDKAGEDFYFLHKCIQMKNFWEINETAVWPSVRESDRVSFGTGASVHRLQSETSLEVYHPRSFEPLKELFGRVGDYWRKGKGSQLPEEDWSGIDTGLAEFLKSRNAGERIGEMLGNSAGEDSFRTKFFAWFNGFMVLKYLNTVNRDQYRPVPVVEAASDLARQLELPAADAAEELLLIYRDFERRRGNRKII
jgi:hypothetical protein